MILCSRLEEEEITVPIEEKEKTIYLQLARNKAEKILKNSRYNYIVYGEEEENTIYLIIRLTNTLPKKNQLYIDKGEL